MTLGGNVCVRNGTDLDYCWQEAVNSLLPVCDEVVVCDGQSTDGTQELIRDWAAKEPKLNVCVWEWTDPVNDIWAWPNWINYARQHLKSDMHIQLDADEVLDDNSYDLVRKAASEGSCLRVKRLNFWRDSKHLIPKGHCCGYEVIRVGPSNLWMPSDYPDPRATELMSRAVHSEIRIMHYGFLRKRDAFFRKAHVVQKIWSGSYDPRLEAAEKYEGNWSDYPDLCDGWNQHLDNYEGSHPRVIHAWLKERGYDV